MSMDQITITFDKGEPRIEWEVNSNGVYKKVSVSVPCMPDYAGRAMDFESIIRAMVDAAKDMSKLEG